MTTHNQFPLLPGSRRCSSVLSAGRKPQKQMKEGGLLLCCCYHWSQWLGQEGRHGGDGEAARSKILGTSGQDLDRHGAVVGWPEGKSLVWSGSLAWQRGAGWSRDGHLIWIGSSQPNVSAGSQHACKREKKHTVSYTISLVIFYIFLNQPNNKYSPAAQLQQHEKMS